MDSLLRFYCNRLVHAFYSRVRATTACVVALIMFGYSFPAGAIGSPLSNASTIRMYRVLSSTSESTQTFKVSTSNSSNYTAVVNAEVGFNKMMNNAFQAFGGDNTSDKLAADNQIFFENDEKDLIVYFSIGKPVSAGAASANNGLKFGTARTSRKLFTSAQEARINFALTFLDFLASYWGVFLALETSSLDETSIARFATDIGEALAVIATTHWSNEIALAANRMIAIEIAYFGMNGGYGTAVQSYTVASESAFRNYQDAIEPILRASTGLQTALAILGAFLGAQTAQARIDAVLPRP